MCRGMVTTSDPCRGQSHRLQWDMRQGPKMDSWTAGTGVGQRASWLTPCDTWQGHSDGLNGHLVSTIDICLRLTSFVCSLRRFLYLCVAIQSLPAR